MVGACENVDEMSKVKRIRRKKAKECEVVDHADGDEVGTCILIAETLSVSTLGVRG